MLANKKFSKMKNRLLPVLFSLFIFLFSTNSSAISLGEISVSSAVGERFYGIVPIADSRRIKANEILVSLAPRSVYQRMGVDWEYFHTQFIFDVQSDETGNLYLTIASREVVFEPYIDFVISFRWPSGFMSKQYTVLLDMPFVEPNKPSANPNSFQTTQPETGSDVPEQESLFEPAIVESVNPEKKEATIQSTPLVKPLPVVREPIVSEPVNNNEKEKASVQESKTVVKKTFPKKRSIVKAGTKPLVNVNKEPEPASLPVSEESVQDQSPTVKSVSQIDENVKIEPVVEESIPEPTSETSSSKVTSLEQEQKKTETLLADEEAQVQIANEPVEIEKNVQTEVSIAEPVSEESVPEASALKEPSPKETASIKEPVEEEAVKEAVVSESTQTEQQKELDEGQAVEASNPAIAILEDESSWRSVSVSGDTLWAIARRVQKESGGRVVDIVDAMFEHNPRAFMRNDMNQLKVNAEINITMAQIKAATPPELRAELFDSLSKAGLIATQNDIKSKSVNESTAKKAQEEGVLSLVAGVDKSQPVSSRTQQLSSELELKQRQLEESGKESEGKVNTIEGRIDNLLEQYSALTQKTEQLKELEEELNRSIVEKVQAEKSIEADLPVLPVQEAEEKTNNTSVWLFPLLAIIAGLAIIVAGLLLLRHALSSKPQSKWDNDILSSDDTYQVQESDLVDLIGEEELIKQLSSINNHNLPEIEGVDDIEIETDFEGAAELQANLFIAYEQFEDAEKLLEEALEKQPDNTAIKEQLKDVYLAQGKSLEDTILKSYETEDAVNQS